MCDIVTNVATKVLMFVGTKVFQSPNLCMNSFSHKSKTKLDFTYNFCISITFFDATLQNVHQNKVMITWQKLSFSAQYKLKII